MNPMILVAHAKPSMGNSFWSINGKMMPPMEPLVIAIPVAFPRLRRKKWPIDDIHGVLMKAPPRPFKTLYTMKKCQYCVHSPSRNIEATRSTDPQSISSLGP
jgi:hypothetical protein